MARLVFITILVLFSCLLYKYGVDGVTNSSLEDDIEIERKLMTLNKTPIRTFKTKDGVYDCVDIYKQPALDHPLLKNHKIQMKPTYQPKSLVPQTSSRENVSVAMVKGINCPQGTVPIRRTMKADLISAKHFATFGTNNIIPQKLDHPGQHVVILKPSVEDSVYFGAKAYINVHGLDVKDDQFSTAQMWIENGSVDQYTSLQAGWMVSPRVSGNKDTRIFIYWTTDNARTNCYNHLCPGFVQVHSRVGPGSRLAPLSTYGGEQYILKIAIFQDKFFVNWWLVIDDNVHIGYWPKSIVPQFRGGVSFVGWGGLASGPPFKDSPPMGNGHYPHGDGQKACYITKLQTVNASNYYVDPKDDRMVSYVDNRQCYGLEYLGYTKSPGLSFLFGRPGGKCGCVNGDAHSWKHNKEYCLNLSL